MPEGTIGGDVATETVRITGHQGREIPAYRPEAAADGWRRIWDWFGRHLTA